jgi:hypothetical protein
MYIVQNWDIYISMLSSQTYRSYLQWLSCVSRNFKLKTSPCPQNSTGPEVALSKYREKVSNAHACGPALMSESGLFRDRSCLPLWPLPSDQGRVDWTRENKTGRHEASLSGPTLFCAHRGYLFIVLQSALVHSAKCVKTCIHVYSGM